MEMRNLGGLGPVSVLSLGGGGLGQVWGETDREEAVATAREAADLGITLFDMAPLYGRGEAETVIGEAFEGKLPVGSKVTTKCMLGAVAPGEVEAALADSLEKSLARMRVEAVDCFILHSNIHPDDYVYGRDAETQSRWAVPYSLYRDHVVPGLQKLVERGLAQSWGITGVGLPMAIMQALREEPAPAVVQVVTNLMDSAGGMRRFEEPAEPRNIIRTAGNNDVGIMGIRAVQAGALTERLDRSLPDDHPEAQDFAKAAPYRELCAAWGEDPAAIAHRYAMGIEGVDTVVLGVKNRIELRGAAEAAEQGPLSEAQTQAIEALGLRRPRLMLPLDATDTV